MTVDEARVLAEEAVREEDAERVELFNYGTGSLLSEHLTLLVLT